MKTTRMTLVAAAAFGMTLFISLGFDVSGKSSATRFDGAWSGLLECSGKEEPWRNPRTTRIRQGVISYSQGEPGQNGFETWEGQIDGKSEVRIVGHYVWGPAETLRAQRPPSRSTR